jgi:hypothetical protein
MRLHQQKELATRCQEIDTSTPCRVCQETAIQHPTEPRRRRQLAIIIVHYAGRHHQLAVCQQLPKRQSCFVLPRAGPVAEAASELDDALPSGGGDGVVGQMRRTMAWSEGQR